jgi:hypothetical protein
MPAMKHTNDEMTPGRLRVGAVGGILVAALLAAAGNVASAAQAVGAAETARAAAPYDLTGYWVSVITQEWRFRMVTPGKGEYPGIPLNLAAKQFADAWSPGPDEAAGQACKAYGVGVLMQLPERLHISWRDDVTLEVQTDAGQQTRLLQFNVSANDRAAVLQRPPSLQGQSVAEWVLPAEPPGRAVHLPVHSATLKVATSQMLPGYLRKNGVPYSANMTTREYWNVHDTANGEQWLAITTEDTDPQYLQAPYVFAVNFKKEPDGSKWDPSPCILR